jgi:quinohemoprotein amine dehydrogenase
MIARGRVLAVVFSLSVPALIVARAQAPVPPPASAQPQRPQTQNQGVSDDGIPVTDPIVVRACGSCHTRDDKQRMTRISDRRATPENWELTIRRMISLNHVQLTPEVARAVIKSLSDSHGLAPEEARGIQFEAERRLIDFTYEGDKDTNTLCSRCHSIGRVLSERRTKDEWTRLLAMHRYYYPGIDGASGGFRRGGPPGTGGGAAGRGRAGDQAAARGGTGDQSGRGGEQEQPMDKARDVLSRAFPLTSKEWTAWSAAMRTPKLAGRWALAGYQIGRGPVFGQLTIADRQGVADGFTTESKMTYSRTGETVSHKSRAIVYTGFQWRGRSADAPDDPGTWREVEFIERNGQQITGRWFTGAYDETGIDITLRRVATDPVVSGTDVSALKTSTSNQRVRIYGANFPASVQPADVDFGQGVRVSRIVSTAPDMVTVDVDVAATARPGPRDLSFGGSTISPSVVVYTKIDNIKVVPVAGLARVGGVTFPNRPEQFEARGVSYGADGKPNTADDLDLGPVTVRWNLEEYTATFRDDDIQFVGEIAQSGLFTPNVEGPNPKRSGNRNNTGDVWVVATYNSTGADASAKPLKARAHLLVTVPLYMDWDSREVGK